MDAVDAQDLDVEGKLDAEGDHQHIIGDVSKVPVPLMRVYTTFFPIFNVLITSGCLSPAQNATYVANLIASCEGIFDAISMQKVSKSS